jgi:DNA cross-link repair 1A protein
MAGGAASIAKSQTTPAPKKAPWSSNNKRSSSTKKNTSILSFFKKTDAPQPNQPRITQFGVKISRTESDSGSGDNSSRKASVSQDNQPSGGLFLEDDKRSSQRLVDIRDGHRNSAKQVKTERTKTPDYDTWDNWHDLRDEDEGKFNENGGSNKRRKVESPPPPPERKNSDPRQRKGPFIDESDSENEDSAEYNYFDTVSASAQAPEEAAGESPNISSATPTAVEPPSLVRAATSKAEEDSDDAVADDFDDIEDELEGEDFMERPWMEEEAQAFGILEDDAIIDTADDTRKTSEVSTCPICQTSLAGLSDSVSYRSKPSVIISC